MPPKFDPKACGADCDNCPLGKNGWLRRKTGTRYQPVGPQIQPTNVPQEERVIAIAVNPADDELIRGYPLAGKSGTRWNELLLQAGYRRDDIDIDNLICCKPPGVATGGFERMMKAIDTENKIRSKTGEPLLKSPVECCRPRLVNQLRDYNRIFTLGGPSSKAITGKDMNITSLRGDFVQIGDKLIVPTFHPSYVDRSPVHAQELLADIGRGFRWFNGERTWKDPVYLRMPKPQQLREWLINSRRWCMENFGRIDFWMDTETDSLEPLTARMRCWAIGTRKRDDEHGAWTVGVNVLSWDGVHRFYPDYQEAEIRRLICEYVLDDPNVNLYGHNIIGYDKRVVERYFYLGDIDAEPLGPDYKNNSAF